jgi:hypothetical protein
MEPGVVFGLAGSVVAVVAALATLRAPGPRLLVLTTGAALACVPIAVSPPAAPLAAAFWMVSVLLASSLLLSSRRNPGGPAAALPLGGLPEVAFGLLGWTMGWSVAVGISAPPAQAGALAAGIGLAFVGTPLAAFARTPIAAGAGAMLALAAAWLVRSAIANRPEDVVFVALAIAVLAVATATARLSSVSASPAASVPPVIPAADPAASPAANPVADTAAPIRPGDGPS